uniref:BPTI/Kunitz inhibitor domain-containing protein n=1 Tax=Sphenodon punctatus TaxID=8508 RepID=A0A8D0HVY1_SPHPU
MASRAPLLLLVGLLFLWAELPDVSSLLLDICKLPPEPSRCRGHFIRFFYNPAAKRCKKFVYGGCRGNKNNFLTQVECLQTSIGQTCRVKKGDLGEGGYGVAHAPQVFRTP